MGLLLLVRHGQASFGTDDYDVLSGTGHEQSRILGRRLAEQGVTPRVVLHGTMRRQRETADGMARAAGWSAPLEVDDRWDEFDHLAVVAAYARATGTAADDLDRRAFQELFELATGRWAGAANDADYTETFAMFVDRVRDAVAHAGRLAGSGETVVAVTSGGPIAAACARLVSLGDGARKLSGTWSRLNTTVVNTSVTRVVVGSTGARLLTYNEHAHLARDEVTYR